MRVKKIIDEDFINYKKPSMFISTCYCDWKCCNELGISTSICQNQPIFKSKTIDVSNTVIINRYLLNNISQSIVFGGLEPVLQFDEILEFVKEFRELCQDDIVIYTGYNVTEIQPQIENLKKYKNIIIKYGRFIPNQNSHFDDVLGVKLASDNQYGERIS